MTPARRLAAWLDLQSRHRRDVAISDLGVDPSYVTHLCAGRLRPGLRVAHAIERLTRGAPGGPIRAEDWLDQQIVMSPRRRSSRRGVNRPV